MRGRLTMRTLVAIIMMCVPFGSALAHKGPAHPASSARGKVAKPFEVGFLEGMIDHHLSAIEMSTWCPKRATHDELKSMCADMGSAQQAEVDTMRRWLHDGYGVSYVGHPAPMKGTRNLKALSGSRFEIAFMEMMIQHHAMAVGMAGECEGKASQAALKDRCRLMAATQTAEIEQMKGWLCRWYQRCSTASRPSPRHDMAYTCPMHPEVVQGGPGECPRCGMALEQKK